MSTGLRRFLGPAPAAEAVPARCELCSAALPADHGHLVDRQERSLPCACRPCYLLFWQAPSGQQRRYAAIPPDYAAVDLALTDADWARLGAPVGLLFVFRQTGVPDPVALYPSPAGATEADLATGVLAELLQRHPVTAALPSDVAALLLHREATAIEAFVVPVDVCYRLVGTVRQTWRGFDGGTEARAAIAAFLEDCRHRTRESIRA